MRRLPQMAAQQSADVAAGPLRQKTRTLPEQVFLAIQRGFERLMREIRDEYVPHVPVLAGISSRRGHDGPPTQTIRTIRRMRTSLINRTTRVLGARTLVRDPLVSSRLPL